MTNTSQLTSGNGRLVPLCVMRGSDRAARLLGELQVAHERLSDAISLKEAVANAPTPVSTRYSLARWQLGRARHVRQRILNDVYAELLQETTAEEALLLRRLQADELDLCQRSSNHLARWTPERIDADWAGFRAAATEVIARVRRRITTEREIIYPMLVMRTIRPLQPLRVAEPCKPWASSAVW